MTKTIKGQAVDVSFTKVFLPGGLGKQATREVNEEIINNMGNEGIILMDPINMEGFIKDADGNINNVPFSCMTVLHYKTVSVEIEAFFANLAYRHKWKTLITQGPTGYRVLTFTYEAEQNVIEGVKS